MLRILAHLTKQMEWRLGAITVVICAITGCAAVGLFVAIDAAQFAFDGAQWTDAFGHPPSLLVIGFIGAIVSLLGMCFGGAIATHRSDGIRHEQDLKLDVALNNMSQGLCMFDASARLVLCNERYLQMYGLSRDLVKPGCTLRELIMHRKNAGTFDGDPDAYVAERLADKRQSKMSGSTAELADGRIINLVNQPIAGGGWVATHEDVTELRRREKELARTQQFLDMVIDNVPATIIVKNARDFRYVLINRPGEESFGFANNEIVGRTAHEFFPKDVADSILTRDKELLEVGQQHIYGDAPIHNAKTGARYVSTKRQIIRDSQGQPQYLLSVIEDITDRRRNEQELARTQRFLDMVIDNVPAAISVKDARDLSYVLINRAGEDIYGMPRAKMIGKTTRDLFPEKSADIVDKRDRQVLEGRVAQSFGEHTYVSPTKGPRTHLSRRVPVLDENGDPLYLLLVIQDLTEQKEAEAKITFLAQHDSLTELPNRTAFNDYLAVTLEKCASAGESFAIVCVDFDRFKEINDVFGHPVGDALLRTLAKRLDAVAEGAFFARLGGDEFAFIVSDDQLPTSAAQLGERLLAAVADEIDIEGNKLQAGLSVGIALYPTDGADQTSLLANATAALHRAKAEGRGSIRFFEADMDQRLRERRSLANDLRSAISRGELTVHYQPQAQIDGEIVGFEALARWQHSVHGAIAPNDFIPLAEETGLILDMGAWILREACREAASWPKPLRIAVNVSPVQLRHGDLVGLVHTVLLETGLAAARLDLEITESVLVDDFARAVSVLRRLKALGVHVAMDDFGTGYSSLQNLQSFSIDKLKIDRSFISNLETNPQSATIVRAVIGLGHGLDLPVVAEGVETQAQLDFLSAEACDEVQGFLIGRPLPIEAYAGAVGRPPDDITTSKVEAA